MTQEDILRMAREAGFYTNHGTVFVNGCDIGADMCRFAALVAAAERERIISANAPEIERINSHIKELEAAVMAERKACAKVAEQWGQDIRVESWDLAGKDCAAAIRARGNK